MVKILFRVRVRVRVRTVIRCGPLRFVVVNSHTPVERP